MRILTITPPPFVASAPASAPSVLTSLLRQEGHDAINFDVNRFCVNKILQSDNLLKHYENLKNEENSAIVNARKASFSRITGHVDKICDLNTFRDFEAYDSSRLAIDEAFALQAQAFGDSHFSQMSLLFQGNHDHENPHVLFSSLHSGNEIFDDFLPAANDYIIGFKPSLIALSVSSIDQLYAALKIAFLVRESFHKCHICLGGAAITRIRNGIMTTPEIFDLVDTVGVYEGEETLVALASAIEGKLNDYGRVPGLLFRKDQKVVHSFGVPNKNYSLDDLPTPVFDDLVEGRWLSPILRLPLSTTRNCYYNKCTFCAISRSFREGFRQMHPDRIFEHVKKLKSSHPRLVIKDVSEAFPPNTIMRYVDLTFQNGGVVPFEACLRFEKPFSRPGVARRLKRGGLKVAYFGLESASTSQLSEMRKNIDLPVVENILKSFAGEGIWNHVFLISGLPRETESDHNCTLEFIKRNRPYMNSVQISPFSLAVDSDIVGLQNRYGFSLKPTANKLFSVHHEVDKLGDLPSDRVKANRVQQLRDEIYNSAKDQLTLSRRIWDAHKIFFTEIDHNQL